MSFFTFRILVIIAAVVMTVWYSTPRAEGLRLEATAGVASYSLAPEGSWWYDGFKQDMKLKVPAWSVGLSYLPWQRGAWRYGLKAGWADLGVVRATNQFPVHEHGGMADARNNPNCDRATLEGCTGQFTGFQKAKGVYFGPAVERKVGDIVLGADIGLFYYRSKWIAYDVKVIDAAGEYVPEMWAGYVQNEMDKEHLTWYASATARYDWLFVQVRRYAAVHAADTERGHMFIGLTSGPVWTFNAGVSLEFN